MTRFVLVFCAAAAAITNGFLLSWMGYHGIESMSASPFAFIMPPHIESIEGRLRMLIPAAIAVEALVWGFRNKKEHWAATSVMIVYWVIVGVLIRLSGVGLFQQTLLVSGAWILAGSITASDPIVVMVVLQLLGRPKNARQERDFLLLVSESQLNDALAIIVFNLLLDASVATAAASLAIVAVSIAIGMAVALVLIIIRRLLEIVRLPTSIEVIVWSAGTAAAIYWSEAAGLSSILMIAVAGYIGNLAESWLRNHERVERLHQVLEELGCVPVGAIFFYVITVLPVWVFTHDGYAFSMSILIMMIVMATRFLAILLEIRFVFGYQHHLHQWDSVITRVLGGTPGLAVPTLLCLVLIARGFDTASIDVMMGYIFYSSVILIPMTLVGVLRGYREPLS